MDELEYEHDYYDELVSELDYSYCDVYDDDEFDPEDMKELHDDIEKVIIDKTWYERRSYIDEVEITFIMKDEQKYTFEMVRDENGYFNRRCEW